MSTPTKTKAEFSLQTEVVLARIDGENAQLAVFKIPPTKADGKLWAEATNVYTETGLTPSELAAQRAKLLGALVDLIGFVQDPLAVSRSMEEDVVCTNARAAIAKATQKD